MASEEVEAAPEAEAPAPEDTAAPSAAAALAPEDNAAQPAAAAPAPEAAAAPAAASPRGMRAGLESSVYHQGELPVRRVPLTATGAPTAASPPAVEPRVGSVLLGAPQLALPPGARTGGSGRVRSRCSAPNQRPKHADSPRPKLRILRHLTPRPSPRRGGRSRSRSRRHRRCLTSTPSSARGRSTRTAVPDRALTMTVWPRDLAPPSRRAPQHGQSALARSSPCGHPLARATP